MTIRIKMLLFFLSLSILILLFGAVRYLHTKSLLSPLTPQSIIRDAESLEYSIDVGNLLHLIQYNEFRTDDALEDYVDRGDENDLQQYYLYDAYLLSEIETSKSVYSPLWNELIPLMGKYNNTQNRILSLSRQHNLAAAKQLESSKEYATTIQMVQNIIDSHLQKFTPASNEKAVVSARLASNKIVALFQSDLHSIIVTTSDIILISLILAFLGSRTISEPVKQLRAEIEKMDMAGKTLPLSPNLLHLSGEVGTLARAFSALDLRLRNVMVSRNELLIEIERREAIEKALRASTLKLEESNRELEQFAYAASHDLRAPLKGIDSLVSWIKEDCEKILPPDSLNHLDLIQSRVRRLDSLIGGILEFSRAGKVLSSLEWLDLNEVMKEIIEDLAPPAHVHIVIDDSLPRIHSDKAIFTQVFLNLISNGIKHNDKTEGEIHIGYKIVDNYYQFYVIDNGPGIAERYHEQIFKPFQTLAPRDVVESTGIGLSIVKKIIESQNGKIWLTSVIGKGTSFYFTWPIEPQEPSSSP